MSNLNGKVILVGKEPGQGRLCVAVSGKMAALGQSGCVPASVSRCMPQQNMAHAKIEVDNNGAMTITNMKPANVTYVDGMEVMSKRITGSSRVSLGKDLYAIDLEAILATAEKMAAAPGPSPTPAPAKEYNISHLRHVWKNYHDKTISRQKHQQKLGLMSSAGMLFTFGGGALMALGGKMGLDEVMRDLMPYLTATGGIVFILSFILRSKDKSIELAEKTTEEFQELYVCPNPDCNKFLGNLSYKLLKKQYGMHCPYCKCKYVEK